MPRVKVPRSVVRQFLEERHRVAGGVSGQDLVRFANQHGLHSVTFRRRILYLLGNDPAFLGIKYLGKRAPDLKVEDITTVVETLQEAPFTPPSTVVKNLNLARQARGLPPIPLRTAYRVVEAWAIGLPRDRKDPLSWFTHARVPVGPSYDPSEARASLDTHFAWSGLSTPHGVSLSETLERLRSAEALFQTLHPGIQPHRWYEQLRPRTPCLGAFLASATLDRAPAISARLTFESQALWLVQARDLLLDQLRRRKGRSQQRVNARHLRRSYELLKDREAQGRGLAEIHLAQRTSMAERALLDWVQEPDTLEDRARALLRLDPRIRETYVKLGNVLVLLTGGFDPAEVAPHTNRARLLLDLARGKVAWEDLPEEERTCLGKNRRLLPLVPPSQQESLRESLLIDRLLDALGRGKITLARSWTHQDLGARIAALPLPQDDRDWPLPSATLEELLAGTYRVDLSPLGELQHTPPPRDEGEDEWSPRPGFMEMAREVHEAILEHHPDWFLTHRRTLDEFWDGSFRMEYDETDFTQRLLQSIGFLGRNLRVRDDPSFVSLKHFLRRYTTPATLERELRFCHDTLATMTGRRAQALLVDTVGREARSTHPWSDWHGRYLIQGFADLRGIGELRLPIYSLAISSKDTEAMNAVELVARARRVVGEDLRIYGGNGHTVSRVSAGLLFGAFKTASAGHIVHPPPVLDLGGRERLRENLPRLNRLFLLLRQSPELGRLFSTRSHVYVEGVNVRPIVDDLGGEVIRAVQATGYDWRAAQPHIESSNQLKRAVAATTGGGLRVEPQRWDLSLLAGELILTMAALWKAREGRTEGSEGLSTALSDVALFRPT